jgi:formiminoglutamase
MSEDIRIGALWDQKTAHWEESRVVLISFPCDEGVHRNGGRPGAAQAPNQILRTFRKWCPDPRHYESHRTILESTHLIDLVLGDHLESNQQILAKEVARALEKGKIPIIIGGGHETSYGHFLGYVEAQKPVSIINWDAHPDVRPLKDELGHSGSPFRQAAEHASSLLKHYSVMGLQAQSVALAHLEYLGQKGFDYVWANDVNMDLIENTITFQKHSTMISIDLDVLDQAYAPGVSAPNAAGLSPEIMCRMAYLAGKNPNVSSFDLVEMNPTYDRDDQTARLAALILWNMTLGIAQRS